MMRRQWLVIVAGWLAISPWLAAQPVNPGATVELPTYTVPPEAAVIDELACDDVVTPPTFYFNVETLLWWTKPHNLDRPVVGSLYNSATDYYSFVGAGGLSDPNAFIAGGFGRIDHGLQLGMRASTQIAFDDMKTVVLELGGLWLPESTETMTYASGYPNGPALSLLYNDVTGGLPGTQSAYPVAGLVGGMPVGGGIQLQTSTELWGGDANLVKRFAKRDSLFYGDILVGYRYQGLFEEFSIRTASALGSTADIYKTRNQFHGGQVGGRLGVQYKSLSLQYMSKFAFGCNDQFLSQGGDGVVPTFYNRPSNSFADQSNRIAYIMESTLNLTWRIAPHVAISGGYSYLYWNRVMRPTNQIDSNINFNQIPGVYTNPLRRDQRGEFWGHGANVSLEIFF